MSRQNIECTVMFADVAGSTALFETIGDAAAHSRIGTCLDLLEEVAGEHGGTVVKRIGDEVMVRYANADGALMAACAMQESIARQPRIADTKLAVRIGFHSGPAILLDGDVFGDAVNVASRMAALAKAGQIITTENTIGGLSEDLVARARKFDRTRVKGKQDRMTLFEVIWEPSDITRLDGSDFTKQQTETQKQLALEYKGERTVLSEQDTALIVGRGASCGLIVDSDLASRAHARIAYRRGKFVLTDQSTNGTFVRTQDGEQVYLRREDIPLWGRGVICLGESTKKPGAQLIEFVCE